MINNINSPLVNNIRNRALTVIKDPSKCIKGEKVLRTWTFPNNNPSSGQVLYTKKLNNGYKKITLVTANADERIPTIGIDSRIINPNGDITNHFYGMRGITNFSIKGLENIQKHINSVIRYNKNIDFLPLY